MTAPGPGRAVQVGTFSFDGAVAPSADAMPYGPAFQGGVFVAVGNLDAVADPEIITGADADGGAHVRALRLDGSDFGVSFFAYDPAFRGGVRVASCDVDGDGWAEIVTAAGPGGGPHVREWSVRGTAVTEVAGFFAYDPAFGGGVFAACRDVDGDGRGEIITAADAGGGPHVRVWQVQGGAVSEFRGFMAYDPRFPGGVRVAVADVDGDGRAEIITGAGPGGGPHVRVWSLASGSLVEVLGFFAYDPRFTGGVFVAGGDVAGLGTANIITGVDAGGGAHVRVLSATLREVVGFFAYDASFLGGVRVTAPR